MEIVQRRDVATLLPIIRAHVAPGTVIHSDEWAAYNRVGNLPNVSSHSVVNHSLHFVDRDTHTSCKIVLEQGWDELKRMKGCHAHQLPIYLDEFMGRAFTNVMDDISTQYQVP